MAPHVLSAGNNRYSSGYGYGIPEMMEILVGSVHQIVAAGRSEERAANSEALEIGADDVWIHDSAARIVVVDSSDMERLVDVANKMYEDPQGLGLSHIYDLICWIL